MLFCFARLQPYVSPCPVRPGARSTERGKLLLGEVFYLLVNHFNLCRKKQSHFGISAERAVSAFGTDNLFFEATLYKGGCLEGGGQ